MIPSFTVLPSDMRHYKKGCVLIIHKDNFFDIDGFREKVGPVLIFTVDAFDHIFKFQTGHRSDTGFCWRLYERQGQSISIPKSKVG